MCVYVCKYIIKRGFCCGKAAFFHKVPRTLNDFKFRIFEFRFKNIKIDRIHTFSLEMQIIGLSLQRSFYVKPLHIICL